MLGFVKYDLPNALGIVTSRICAEYRHHSYDEDAMATDRAFGDTSVMPEPSLEFSNPCVDLGWCECCAWSDDSADRDETKKSTDALPPPRRALALMGSELIDDGLGYLVGADSRLIQPANEMANGGQIHSQGLLG